MPSIDLDSPLDSRTTSRSALALQVIGCVILAIALTGITTLVARFAFAA
jgi:hypothetical protein